VACHQEQIEKPFGPQFRLKQIEMSLSEGSFCIDGAETAFTAETASDIAASEQVSESSWSPSNDSRMVHPVGQVTGLNFHDATKCEEPVNFDLAEDPLNSPFEPPPQKPPPPTCVWVWVVLANSMWNAPLSATAKASPADEEKLSCPEQQWSPVGSPGRPRKKTKEQHIKDLISERKSALREGKHNIADILQRIYELSLQEDGCLWVQAALELITIREVVDVVVELLGKFVEMSTDMYGNYVVQTIILLLSKNRENKVKFIIDDLWDRAFHVACNKYGCRMFVKLLCGFSENPDLQKLNDWLLKSDSDTLNLATHKFGKFVAETLLEHGTSNQRGKVIANILPKWRKFLYDKGGLHVLKTVLKFGGNRDVADLASRLQDGMETLNASETGRMVTRELQKQNWYRGEDRQALKFSSWKHP